MGCSSLLRVQTKGGVALQTLTTLSHFIDAIDHGKLAHLCQYYNQPGRGVRVINAACKILQNT